MSKRRKPNDDGGLGCHNCKHWREQTESADEVQWGHCHRYPPQLLPVSVEDEAELGCSPPWTTLPFLCGEHSPRLQ